jgi:hypothetical protein
MSGGSEALLLLAVVVRNCLRRDRDGARFTVATPEIPWVMPNSEAAVQRARMRRESSYKFVAKHLYRSPWRWPTRPPISTCRVSINGGANAVLQVRLLGQGLVEAPNLKTAYQAPLQPHCYVDGSEPKGALVKQVGGVIVDDVEVEHEHTSVFDDDGRETERYDHRTTRYIRGVR